MFIAMIDENMHYFIEHSFFSRISIEMASFLIEFICLSDVRTFITVEKGGKNSILTLLMSTGQMLPTLWNVDMMLLVPLLLLLKHS